jgi:hypothetical protein
MFHKLNKCGDAKRLQVLEVSAFWYTRAARRNERRNPIDKRVHQPWPHKSAGHNPTTQVTNGGEAAARWSSLCEQWRELRGPWIVQPEPKPSGAVGWVINHHDVGRTIRKS